MSSKSEFTNIFYDLREVRIVNNLKLRPVHKLVLFVLESRGDEISPSKSTIAKDCGYSKGTVDNAITELKNADLLRIKQRFNNSNLYFLNEKAFNEEANRIRHEKQLIKKRNEALKDPSYDPWDENLTPELEDQIEFVDIEIDEITRIKNEQVLSNMWDSINSVSSQ